MTFEQQTFQRPVLFILEGQTEYIVVASHRQQLAGFFRLLLVHPAGQLANAAAFAEAPRVAQHHHLLGEWMCTLGVFLQATGLQTFATDRLQPLACVRAVPACLGITTQVTQHCTGLH
ncbi:hypothetical protein D3C72_1857420 [compost metagenome]